MIKRIFFTLLIFVFAVNTSAQNPLQGIVTDAETGESVIGCNILLQGTTLGTITGMNGEYTFKNIPNGTYNVIYSFISYEKQIQKVTISKGSALVQNIKLKAASTQIKDVVVTGTRRTDTELSLLMNNKLSVLTVNGISSQQIAKSQDKDASEVIRRIPGVSIREGKFVIVRGLTERYNSVWLNGSSTPSSESDVRAFSFDVIPSGQIDNILIYKSPAPELPADFAGAMINIKTKSLIDKNSITFSYSYGTHQGTTGKDFYTYQGGKTDWLGYDDGTRSIPSGIPTTEDFRLLFDQTDNTKIAQINSISKSFNSILTPTKKTANPDADFQLGINKRFTVGDFSIGSISTFGYNSTNTTTNSSRPTFEAFGYQATSNDQFTYSSKNRVNVLSNWVFLFGNNQKIEFRNLFNNYGDSKTVTNNIEDFVNNGRVQSYELAYESRMTYSGQLAGNHSFNNDKSKFDWTLAYSYANKNQPDLRRLSSSLRLEDSEPNTKYELDIPNLSRLYLNNDEFQKNASVNYSQKLNIGTFKPELKAGIYLESKSRNFNSRRFTYSKQSGYNVYLDKSLLSYRDSGLYTNSMMSSIQNFFNTKMDYKTGIIMNEMTDKADSYSASNDLIAGYISANLPITSWANVYAGARMEKNNQQLNSFKRDGSSTTPVSVKRDTINIFPSINATVNLSKNLLIRLSGGETVNRPEFREISTFAFYSFEEKTFMFGNENLKNCYITNYDARIELYPSSEEIVSLGAFYKDFKNPIEQHIIHDGTAGWSYTYSNANNAKSYGLELDIRKRLHELENAGAFSFLSNLTFVVNASLIKSEITVDTLTQRSGKRELQGQSPYIINLGAYYQDTKSKFMASIMYNKVGQRISFVGDKNTPHVYEMPFNSLDITVEKGITKWASLKFGVKNLLDNNIVFQQTDEYTDPVSKLKVSKVELRQQYKPGMQIKLGISLIF
ncbi:MAG: TonB-dependent receptor [Paludibacter sp.]